MSGGALGAQHRPGCCACPAEGYRLAPAAAAPPAVAQRHHAAAAAQPPPVPAPLPLQCQPVTGGRLPALHCAHPHVPELAPWLATVGRLPAHHQTARCCCQARAAPELLWGAPGEMHAGCEASHWCWGWLPHRLHSRAANPYLHLEFSTKVLPSSSRRHAPCTNHAQKQVAAASEGMRRIVVMRALQECATPHCLLAAVAVADSGHVPGAAAPEVGWCRE